MRRTARLLAVFVVVTLASMPGASGLARAGKGMATVTIVHGLPDFTADIYVNGDLLIDGFKPTFVTDPMELPAGTYDVAIREVGAASTSTPALEGSLTLKAGDDVSVVAHLSSTASPALTVFHNKLSKIPAGRSLVLLRNAAEAPAVDLVADGTPVVEGVAPEEQDKATLRASSYAFGVETAADQQSLVKAQDVSLKEGRAYALYLIGSREDSSLEIMVQAFSGLSSAPSLVNTGDGGAAGEPAGLPPLAVVILVLSVFGLMWSTWIAASTRRAVIRGERP